MELAADLSGIVFILGTLALGVIVLVFARRAGVRGLEAPPDADASLDPVVKADMYLSRGWHTQARAMLEETVRHDPLRDDVRRKLARMG